MDTPQGLLEAQYPAYVTDLNEVGEIDFRGRTVKLCNPSFLGAAFKQHRLHPFPGINVDLGQRCIRAQKALYALAHLEKSARLAKEGKPAPDSLSEDEFRRWCWFGQLPSSSGDLSVRIAPHSGLADRPGGNSKHASGSAMDLNVVGNPWMPVRGKDGTLGGEVHKEKTKDFTGDLVALHRDKIWKPAMEIFDRAHRMFRGKPAQIHPDKDVSNAGDMYTRFKDLSNCLEAYFSYGFHPFLEKPASQRKKTFDEFQVGVLGDAVDGAIHADAVHVDGSPLIPRLAGPDSVATLQALSDQIAKDYAFIPFALVSGTLSADAAGNFSLPSGTQRDPTSGVFNIRNEVFMELVVNQKLRWGGCMFDRNSGDGMHFDLFDHVVDGEVIK